MATGTHVEEVEAQILAQREAMRAEQACLQAAEQLEVDAMAAEQQARDAQAKAQRIAAGCRESIRAYANEIDLLIDEHRALIPQQRKPTT